MKILYAVQATGNGHISRAIEILPHLEKYGTVEIFLSGSNSNLLLDNVKYRSKGISFSYSGNGGINYFKTIIALQPCKIYKEILQLPVEKYDLVINDFESITALACAKKKIKSIGFGHQASFMSKHTPRPKHKSFIGEFILNNYAKASAYVGLNFNSYDTFILPPIIRNDIWNATPKNNGHIAVYLMAYSNEILQNQFSKFKNFSFQIFSKQTTNYHQIGNVIFLPIDKNTFTESLINCFGIITGAGFETPAEAIYLQKKILVMPIKGQYEQECNAAALENLGIKTFEALNENFEKIFLEWTESNSQQKISYTKNTETIIREMMEISKEHINKPI